MKLPGWLGHPYTHASGILLSLLGALAVVAFMLGTLEYTKLRGRLLLTALVLAGYLLTMLIATATPREGVMRWLYVLILGSATLALFLLLLGLWAAADSNEFWKSAASIAFLTLGLSITGLALGLGASFRSARMLSRVSAGLGLALTVITVLGIALGIGAPLYWWAFAILSLFWLVVSTVFVSVRLWRRRGAG